VYPFVFLDAIHYKVKENHQYVTKAAYVVLGIHGGGGSASFHYISRPLLTTEEVKKVVRPHQLVLSRHDPAILYAPDISKTIFNEMLGMGDKEHNIRLSIIRNDRRAERYIRAPQLWGVWKAYEHQPVPQGVPTLT